MGDEWGTPDLAKDLLVVAHNIDSHLSDLVHVLERL